MPSPTGRSDSFLMTPIPPGSTIGIVGGGQLGRMMALAAARLGYHCHIYDPHPAPCAAEVSGNHTRGRYDDEASLRQFAAACDVVTYEFENLEAAPLFALGPKLRPGTRSLELAQDRGAEKRFLQGCGAAIAPWRMIDGEADISAALDALGAPILLKTRRDGYDGKGQAWVRSSGDFAAAWDAIGRKPAVAEAGVDFAAEFSVVIARTAAGETRAFPVSRNDHEGGILRRSTVPAGPLVEPHIEQATRFAEAIVAGLDHIGVLTVEFFATAAGPVVNEFAPRVHNSGHWTIEGATTSQFEQHLRCILDLPIGDVSLVASGATMDNLIGADVAKWLDYVAEPGAHLHLYGKGEARPGRKMGHITRLQ